MTTRVRKSKRVTIKIPRELHDAMKKLRARTGVPLSSMMRLAMHLYTRAGIKGVRLGRGTKRGSR